MHQPSSNTPLQEKKNDVFLLKIAEAYLRLEDLHRMGPEHWPEDEDPLLLCMSRLLDVAYGQPIHTPQGVMALTAMTSDGWDLKSDQHRGEDNMDHKAARAARDMLLSGEFVIGGW